MPIQELVDFFNDRFHEGRVQFLPDEPLRLEGDRVVGHFVGYRLHSRFRPLVKAITRHTLSHEACTHVLDAAGHAQSPRDPFDTASAANGIVHADRLCRLVHMLNYLVHSERYETLFLRVDPRHVLAVRADHGRYFEDVLHRCGLAPSQVVITLDGALRGPERPALIHGMKNYRRNGYRISTLVDRTTIALDGIEPLTELAPDCARLDGAFVQAALARQSAAGDYLRVIEALRDRGTTVIQEGVETETQARFAAACGIELMSGPLAGAPAEAIHWQPVPSERVLRVVPRPVAIRFCA